MLTWQTATIAVVEIQGDGNNCLVNSIWNTNLALAGGSCVACIRAASACKGLQVAHTPLRASVNLPVSGTVSMV